MSVFLRCRWRLCIALLLPLVLWACNDTVGDGHLEPTLEQKIGQMVMMGFAGTDPSHEGVQAVLNHIEAERLGGVVFYRYNVESPEQTRALNQALMAATPGSLPLLRAIDQEGGLVQRLNSRNGHHDHPSAQAVAESQTPEQAYDTYRDQASMVREAGFNFNLAPVVDLYNRPGSPSTEPGSPVIGGLGRAFASDPATVMAYASAAIRAHRDTGVLTSLKHYPGHGLARGDSHQGLVDVTDDYQPIERAPFRGLIAAGLADSVMGAHLVNRNVDPLYPVTLSTRYLEPWLRQEDGLGEGVIVTDDLFMGAIQRHHDFEEIVVRAIQAGNDLLIFSNNPAAAPEIEGFEPQHDIPLQVIEVVMAAINRGELSATRIHDSWQRLQEFRARAAF